MKTGLVCVAGVMLTAAVGLALSMVEGPWMRQIPIPAREHGYSNFETQVLNTQAELTAFLEAVAKQTAWNERDAFLKAIAAAKVDFSQERLVLLRHTEGSGSVRVTFQKPTAEKDTLVLRIDRKVPQVGTADMAYYCFAVAVRKEAAKQAELRLEGKPPVTIAFGGD